MKFSHFVGGLVVVFGSTVAGKTWTDVAAQKAVDPYHEPDVAVAAFDAFCDVGGDVVGLVLGDEIPADSRGYAPVSSSVVVPVGSGYSTLPQQSHNNGLVRQASDAEIEAAGIPVRRWP